MNSTGKFSAFLLAGVQSGSGKTTLTLALLAALARRGLTAAPFKCGPDYIDGIFHRQISGRDSGNLDAFLLGDGGVARSFAAGCQGADAAVVEGVMGLFDGYEPGKLAGSSAEIAATLDLPVILTVNARGLSGSIAPLVRGFVRWRPEVRVTGVIADFVGSDRHAEILRQALEEAGDVPLLGAFRRNDALTLPERHLGLATESDCSRLVRQLAEQAEQDLDIDRLLRLTERPRPRTAATPDAAFSGKVRLGVARDEAFQFYYADNLRMLEASGAETVPFSPLRDAALPDGLDGLYLGGGFPELHAEALAANRAMKQSIRDFAARGRPVYGECGGYLYLLEKLTDRHGRSFDFTGLLPGTARMTPRLAGLGYRELVTARESFFGPAGTRLRGHEFHYSVTELPPGQEALFHAADLRGRTIPMCGGSCRGQVAGSYAHIHFASAPRALRNFVEALKIHE